MRKQVRKQVEKMQAVERDRYRTACAEIRLLKLKIAELEKALHISRDLHERLCTIHEELQTDSEKEIRDLSLTVRVMRDTIDRTIAYEAQPWWQKLFRRGVEEKKGS